MTAVCGMVLTFCGCGSPRFQQKQEKRDERIAYHLNAYAAHETEGMDRVHQTLDLHARLNEQRAQHLTFTCGMVRDQYENDVRRWNVNRTRRRESIRAIFHGRPDSIPDTWAKMVY